MADIVQNMLADWIVTSGKLPMLLKGEESHDKFKQFMEKMKFMNVPYKQQASVAIRSKL